MDTGYLMKKYRNTEITGTTEHFDEVQCSITETLKIDNITNFNISVSTIL